MSDNIKMPTKHPGPYKSLLWDHLDEIEALRRKKYTWQSISEILAENHGLRLAHTTICNWHKRYRFSDERPEPEPKKPKVTIKKPKRVVEQPQRLEVIE